MYVVQWNLRITNAIGMTAFVLLMEVVLCSEVISINFTTRNKTYVGMAMVKKNRDKANI